MGHFSWSALAATIQSLAIVIGVFVTINELVVKRDARERSRIEVTLPVIDKVGGATYRGSIASIQKLNRDAHSIPVGDDDREQMTVIKSEFVKEVRDLNRAYRLLFSCHQSRYCDPPTLEIYFCDETVALARVISEVSSRVCMMTVDMDDYRYITRFVTEVCVSRESGRSAEGRKCSY